MSSQSRTHNALRNSVVGVGSHLFTALFSFASRTVFVRVLGAQYLGISGLFSNILTMLALSDLGVYTVMVYSLYQPLAQKDEKKTTALIWYFQRLYYGIGMVVLGLGLCCIPLLPYLINNSTLTYGETVFYYVLLLLNTVCSYVAISKSTLLRADQQVHIVQIVSAVSTFALQLLQIVILLLTHQYAFYLIAHIVVTLGSNVTMTVIAKKKYPFIRQKPECTLVDDIKDDIKKNLKATFLYKIGNTVMNSTDNILISVIVGTVFVGYYANYVTIFTVVNSFVMILIQAMLASVGNFYTTQNDERKFGLFRVLMLGFCALAAFCASCYICGMNDFIRMWLGKEYLLSNAFVLSVALNRFVFVTIHPLWITRESCGVFVSTKYVMIVAAGINVVLSVLLGRLWGISGIILATALSNLVTVFWYEPGQLCQKVFHINQKQYWGYFAHLAVAAVPPIAIALIMQQHETNNFFVLFVRFLICGLLTAVSFWCCMGKSQELNWLKNNFIRILKKKAH